MGLARSWGFPPPPLGNCPVWSRDPRPGVLPPPPLPGAGVFSEPRSRSPPPPSRFGALSCASGTWLVFPSSGVWVQFRGAVPGLGIPPPFVYGARSRSSIPGPGVGPWPTPPFIPLPGPTGQVQSWDFQPRTCFSLPPLPPAPHHRDELVLKPRFPPPQGQAGFGAKSLPQQPVPPPPPVVPVWGWGPECGGPRGLIPVQAAGRDRASHVHCGGRQGWWMEVRRSLGEVFLWKSIAVSLDRSDGCSPASACPARLRFSLCVTPRQVWSAPFVSSGP